MNKRRFDNAGADQDPFGSDPEVKKIDNADRQAKELGATALGRTSLYLDQSTLADIGRGRHVSSEPDPYPFGEGYVPKRAKPAHLKDPDIDLI